MWRRAALFLGSLSLAAVVGAGSGGPAGTASADATITSEVVVPGAEFPVSLEFAPDGRLFYNELRNAKIRIVEDGALLPAEFAQLPPVNPTGEHGLLGLALDPDYETNGYVYVMNSVPNESGDAVKNQVVRFTDVNNVGTDQTVIVDDLSVGPCCHDGGRIGFGADGKLYVTIGDNQVSADAQDPDSIRGKILRYNPDGSIPSDNPIAGSPVWALGLRNPFGLAFHPFSEALYVTDNGPNMCDELNLVVESANYGWPLAYETNSCLVGTGTEAIHWFAADGFDPWEAGSPSAPTGVEYIDGDVYPALGHSLVACEWNTGEMQHLSLGEPALETVVAEAELTSSGCQLDIDISPTGEIYYSSSGAISRLLVDSDSDGVLDGADNCPAWPNAGQGLPPWTVAANDADCDGFSREEERFVGTDPTLACASTSDEDDEEEDGWPADLNDSQTVNILDMVQLTPPVFNASPPDPSYSVRKDLDASGAINILDLVRMTPPVFNQSCA